MDIVLGPLLQVILMVLYFYRTGLLIYMIIYFLEHFEIIYKNNPIVYKVHTILFALYEPLLEPIRSRIPLQVDISFIILYLILTFFNGVIIKLGSRFAL